MQTVQQQQHLLQGSAHEAVEVRESGRALKVHTEHPHLVSMGSGRLSTSVTLHPIPEGQVTVGSSREADIVLQGTGVEPRHCVIDNSRGVVTLHPLAAMTVVDGQPVTSATRLTQGTMLCLGRSNLLRFNHPAEAKLMQSFLPNTRISMAVPLNFLAAPPRRPDEPSPNTVLHNVSKFETLALANKAISPKVFPLGSVTVNSPASAVLLSRSAVSPHMSYIEAPIPRTIASFPQKASLSYAPVQSCAAETSTSPRALTMPSPAFNRNPTPYVPDRFRSVTPNMFAARTSPITTPQCSHRSYEELNARAEELEWKKLQAQSERRLEQETQMLEKQRLEEILSMCAEYERQAQETTPVHHNKPLHSTTLHQNRIITNGSLPRDKRSLGTSASEDELSEIFTFDRVGPIITTSSTSTSACSPYENLDTRPHVTAVVTRRVCIENTLVVTPSDEVAMMADYDIPDPIRLPKYLTPTEQLSKFSDLSELITSLETSDECNDLPESERDHRHQQPVDEGLVRLRKDKSMVLGVISELKRDVKNIEVQEEDILREVEMEKALLSAELSSQKEKQAIEEERLGVLQEKQRQLDREIESCGTWHGEIQDRCKERIDQMERELEGAAAPQALLDCLEAERKAFEDLEFKQLEEEANWLATKEEVQREIFEVSAKVETRKQRLAELQQQLGEVKRSSQSESGALEMEKLEVLKRLEEARTRLKDLDNRLSMEVEQDQGSGDDTPRLRPKSKQSQEDLARISRVTADAPIDIGKTGSLGRKTVESLKEIERNRQLLLAKQGSQVIEGERKRVEDLKRRKRNEALAEWERSRQRECNSLNSVGSEDSSEQPTESASSDEVDKMASSARIETQNVVQYAATEEAACRDSLPVSEYSGSECEQQAVRKREVKPSRLMQQRPLTRYLPMRGELNLRQHIEGAGHQVELCRDVTVDATTCRGTLHKLGGKFHNWNKRWFVFDRARRSLTYYSDRGEKKPRGGSYFQAIEEVYVDHSNSVKAPHAQLLFVIKTHERTYHLMAPSPEAMRIWVDVVFTGAEGYHEFEPGC